jgi:hypothetical protein
MRIDSSPGSILILVAVALFVLDALDVRLGSLSLLSLGLAAFAASFLFRRGGLGLG